MSLEITVYTDGSSLGNPGPGGWGALLLSKNRALELAGREAATTNNRMELQALIGAFQTLAELSVTDYEITVHADSTYVLGGVTKWVEGWKKNGWKKADKKPVLNQDLWQQLDDLKLFLEAENKLFFEHVKAHVGHKYNERVDDLARWSAEDNIPELYDGPLDDYQC